MIDLSKFEALKSADLEALLRLQELMVKADLVSDPKILNAYLKITELKTKLLGYEFERSQKVLTGYKRIVEKLLMNISKGLEAKNSNEALLNIVESLSDFSTQTEVALFEAGYSLESHNTLELLREKLESLKG